MLFSIHEKEESDDSRSSSTAVTETMDKHSDTSRWGVDPTAKTSPGIVVRSTNDKHTTHNNIDNNLPLSQLHPQPSPPIPITTSPRSPFPSLLHEIFFVSLVCTSQALTQAGLAQAIAPLHTIGATFGTTNVSQLSWLPAAYSLTVGTFILPAGRWGDLYGHRLLFLVGWLFYAFWTLLAGFSAFTHSLVFFAVCRAMQGIGPAILLPNALAILGRTYPQGGRKNMVFAIFGATAPVGFIVGALMAGVFEEWVWWPWNFWVCGIVMLGCAVLTPLVIPSMNVGKESESGMKKKVSWEELDVWGTVTGVSGLVLVNFAWNEAPSAGWSEPYVYSLLIVGVLVLSAFFWIEFRVTRYPLLPSYVFNLDNNLVLGCIALGWASFGVWVYYLWQFQGVIKGHSILVITAQQTPSGPMGIIAAILTGLALGIIGPGWTMLCAMVAFLLGNVLLAIADPSTTYWGYIFVANVIMPVGLDMSFPAGCLIMSNFMPIEKQGMAASVLLVILNYSISIGLGMAGTVEAHVKGGDLLRGIRAALYFAIGLDGLGLILAAWLTFVLVRRRKALVKEQVEAEKPEA